MKTIYARQCSPESSFIFKPFSDGDYEDVIVFGNRRYPERIPEKYEDIFYIVRNDNLLQDLEDFENGNETEFYSLEDLINFYFSD